MFGSWKLAFWQRQSLFDLLAAPLTQTSESPIWVGDVSLAERNSFSRHGYKASLIDGWRTIWTASISYDLVGLAIAVSLLNCKALAGSTALRLLPLQNSLGRAARLSKESRSKTAGRGKTWIRGNPDHLQDGEPKLRLPSVANNTTQVVTMEDHIEQIDTLLDFSFAYANPIKYSVNQSNGFSALAALGVALPRPYPFQICD